MSTFVFDNNLHFHWEITVVLDNKDFTFFYQTVLDSWICNCSFAQLICSFIGNSAFSSVDCNFRKMGRYSSILLALVLVLALDILLILSTFSVMPRDLGLSELVNG